MRISGLSSFITGKKDKENDIGIGYDFDVLLYAGITKPGDKSVDQGRHNRQKNKGNNIKSKSYRPTGPTGNTAYGISSTFSNSELDEATTSMSSNSKSVTHSRGISSRQSRKVRNNNSNKTLEQNLNHNSKNQNDSQRM